MGQVRDGEDDDVGSAVWSPSELREVSGLFLPYFSGLNFEVFALVFS